MPAAEVLGGEPTSSALFLFEVDGVEIGTFRSLRGLELTVGVEEYVEGGQNGYAHKLPGVLRWPNLVFERGLIESDALFTWVANSAGENFAARGNKLTRSTGAVTAISYTGERLRAWELQGVFAVRWEGPAFDVDREEQLVERLEVAHNGFRAKTS
ncbi:phage tail protein [Cellulomonas cellasea]|uniref:phage tail protein n=1 Tax=Cellulomonas cellasea TaxID=43670 RepID=UPI0025A41071|nr:phage tail protein [Cellulomonas cellasea]MDM8085475.1 phage tail protein [Cellulomonas cellasea]